MTIKDTLGRLRDRIDPDRAEQAARAAGRSEAEIARARRSAQRRRRLLRSGGAGGGSVSGG